MKFIKKLIRGIVKIPATIVVVPFVLGGVVTLSLILFFQWLYEKEEFDKKITRDMIFEDFGFLKKWVTTV